MSFLANNAANGAPLISVVWLHLMGITVCYRRYIYDVNQCENSATYKQAIVVIHYPWASYGCP